MIMHRLNELHSTTGPPRDTPNILDGVVLPSNLMDCVAPLHGFHYKEVDDDGNVVDKNVDGERLREEVDAALGVVDMEFGPAPACGSVHGLATIRVYSGKTMFNVVNSSLRSSQRSEATLRPLLPFLKLLLHTLRNLPKKYQFQGTAYRCESGVHPNFAKRYERGRKTAFYGFTSCTTNPAVLSQFGARSGVRTLFHLQVSRGYRIDAFSNFPDEAEVLLEPCVTFEISGSKIYSGANVAVLKAANAWNDNMEGLHEVNAVQVKSVYELLKSEGSIMVTSPGDTRESNATMDRALSNSSRNHLAPATIATTTTASTSPQPQPTYAPETPLPPTRSAPALAGPPSTRESSMSSPPVRPPDETTPPLSEQDRQCIAQIVEICQVPESTAVQVYLAEERNMDNAVNSLLGQDPNHTGISLGDLLQHLARNSAARESPEPRPELTEGVAQFNLGCMYDRGEGGKPQDDRQAAEWYEKAAQNGIANAMFNLGNMYRQGRGVSKDLSRSMEWYEKAASQGHHAAQYNLAVMLDTGVGGPAADDRLAAQWYERAAAGGIAAAQFNVANMYAAGRGVPHDEQKAEEWYNKAYQQGIATAAE